MLCFAADLLICCTVSLFRDNLKLLKNRNDNNRLLEACVFLLRFCFDNYVICWKWVTYGYKGFQEPRKRLMFKFTSSAFTTHPRLSVSGISTSMFCSESQSCISNESYLSYTPSHICFNFEYAYLSYISMYLSTQWMCMPCVLLFSRFWAFKFCWDQLGHSTLQAVSWNWEHIAVHCFITRYREKIVDARLTITNTKGAQNLTHSYYVNMNYTYAMCSLFNLYTWYVYGDF